MKSVDVGTDWYSCIIVTTQYNMISDITQGQAILKAINTNAVFFSFSYVPECIYKYSKTHVT